MSTGPSTDSEWLSIGDVSRLTRVEPHVLRYWERTVRVLRPSRRRSGHRRFSRADVELVTRIRDLVQDRGFTLEGARKQLRAESRRGAAQTVLAFDESSAAVATLRDVRRDLNDILGMMRSRDGELSASLV
jgi:DNA-binding transcriptional MerR regulator